MSRIRGIYELIKSKQKSLTVDSALASFIENDVLEGLDIDPNKFWSNFEDFLKEYSLLANQFLKTRDDIQSQIDQWHINHKGHPHDQEEYESFLVDIGYILPRPDSVTVNTSNVDPEISNIAAPQLVVPIDNARYALNAANARWEASMMRFMEPMPSPKTMELPETDHITHEEETR